MNEFKTYHPAVNFLYFLFVISLSCFLMHPICLCISLFCAITYTFVLHKRKAVRFILFPVIPITLISALVNTLFNHKGMTILFYLPGDNPLTLESVIYGLASGMMISSVICWFYCFEKIVTSDKFLYLFGKISPSLSLILTMVFRFVPDFISAIKKNAQGQMCIGIDVKNGNIIKRIKNGLNVFYITLQQSLENSVDTADSMKSRGYGVGKRTFYTNYIFRKRDFVLILIIVLTGIFGFLTNFKVKYTYFPKFKTVKPDNFGMLLLFMYFIMCMIPVFLEIKEEIKWSLSK